MAENFFGIMKSELLYAEKFESPEAFIKALNEYIDYYNNKRIKSRLNGKSPVQYRTLSPIPETVTPQAVESKNIHIHTVRCTLSEAARPFFCRAKA